MTLDWDESSSGSTSANDWSRMSIKCESAMSLFWAASFLGTFGFSGLFSFFFLLVDWMFFRSFVRSTLLETWSIFMFLPSVWFVDLPLDVWIDFICYFYLIFFCFGRLRLLAFSWCRTWGGWMKGGPIWPLLPLLYRIGEMDLDYSGARADMDCFLNWCGSWNCDWLWW